MKSVMMKLACGGLLAGLLGLGVTQTALAIGTASDTDINNRATVDYQVGGVDQTAIESSPTGNSTPGVNQGQDTTFKVDNKVDVTVTEVGGVHTSVNPGQADAVTVFRVTNTGNTPQDYALSAANLNPGDIVHGLDDTGAQMNNLRVFVDGNGNGTYDAGVDTATFIDSLAPDDGTNTTFATVFVLGDTSIGDSNGDVANVRLTAVTHDAGSGASSVTTETAGPDDPNAVDVVLADAGRDGTEAADDGYLFESADLSVQKAAVVISDPFNGTTNPKAIPQAVIEYTITITNSGTTDATSVRITDILDANVTLRTGEYAGSDVEVTSGAGTTQCTADAGDGDGDGCGLTGATLEVGPGGGLTIGTNAGVDDVATVRFRVEIN